MTLQVFFYRLGISIVKLRLKALNLLYAQIVNFGVYLHVLLFGEDNIFVASAEERLEGDESVLAQILPLLREHLVVVDDDVVRRDAVMGRLLLPAAWKCLLLRHHSFGLLLLIF